MKAQSRLKKSWRLSINNTLRSNQYLVKLVLLFAVAVFYIMGIDAWAQNLKGLEPGAMQKREQERLEHYRFQKKLEEAEKPRPEQESVEDKTKTPAETKPKGPGRVIFIKKILTNPSEILTSEELQKIIHPYEGKQTSIHDLFEVIEKINELYRAKKIIAAKAFLPPQKVEGGIIKIRLIEGHVGKIEVEGNKATKDSFFENRISLKSGDLIKLDTLEKNIIYFNRTNDVQIRAELKPGEEFGTTDCVFKTEEPQKYYAALFFDNAGREDVGLERLGMYLSNNSLLGYRDVLTIGASKADGTNSGNVSYNFPINTLGTRIAASYGFNQIKIRSGPLEHFDIKGDSYDIGLDLSHPLYVERRWKLSGMVGYHKEKSNTEFAGVPLSDIKARCYIFGFDFHSDDDYGSWDVFHRFTHANSLTYGTVENDRQFLKYYFSAARLQRLKDKYIAIFRGSAQWADSHLLPSFEQFQVGGQSTVRGYSEGALIGDRGYTLSAEFIFPLPFRNEKIFNLLLKDNVKGVAFIDHGAAFPYRPDGNSVQSNDFITGVGFGITFKFSKYFTGRLNLGIPLRNVGESDYKDVRFHFYLQSNFI